MTLRHATTAPKIRFSVTVGEEPEVEVAMAIKGLCAQLHSPQTFEGQHVLASYLSNRTCECPRIRRTR